MATIERLKSEAADLHNKVHINFGHPKGSQAALLIKNTRSINMQLKSICPDIMADVNNTRKSKREIMFVDFASLRVKMISVLDIANGMIDEDPISIPQSIAFLEDSIAIVEKLMKSLEEDEESYKKLTDPSLDPETIKLEINEYLGSAIHDKLSASGETLEEAIAELDWN